MSTAQKGRNDLKLASLRRDRELVELARDAAFEIVDADPDARTIIPCCSTSSTCSSPPTTKPSSPSRSATPVPSLRVRRQEKAERIGEILDDLYPEPPIPLDHVDPFTLLVAVGPLGADHRQEGQPGHAGAVRRRRHAGEDGGARPGPDPRASSARSASRPTKAQEPLARRQPDRRRRRRGAPRLGVPRVARRRRPQDGERGDGAGVRRAGVPGRHPHPPARRALGPVRRDAPSSRPSATSRRRSRARRGTAATCRSSTSAASTARRCATTSPACPICSFAATKKRAASEPQARMR